MKVIAHQVIAEFVFIYEPIKIWNIFKLKYDFSNYPVIVTVGVMLSSCLVVCSTARKLNQF